MQFLLHCHALDRYKCIGGHCAADIVKRFESLRELESASGEELSALMPSILDKAFKGEL